MLPKREQSNLYVELAEIDTLLAKCRSSLRSPGTISEERVSHTAKAYYFIMKTRLLILEKLHQEK